MGTISGDNTEKRKRLSPVPAAVTFGGDSREAKVRGFAYGTWPGRTGNSRGELPEAAPLSTSVWIRPSTWHICRLGLPFFFKKKGRREAIHKRFTKE